MNELEETNLLKGLSKDPELLKLSDKAMEIMGYIVIAEGDWIIKKYKNGKIKKIEKFR